MAAGDFTINANTKTTNGRFHQVSGTAEIDGTKRAFNIFPSGYIVHFHVDPFDDSGSVTAEINLDASAVADNGNVALESSTVAVNTYNWTAVYV
jgi:hypothetical protein